ncbi:MAG: thiosulfate oxidation carrier protein SoxY [Pseudomonadota bacterium]
MINRRRWIRRSSAATAVLALKPLTGLAALATTDAFETALNDLRAGRRLNQGRVDLYLPALAENGNSVGLTVSVATADTAPVTQLWLLSPRNPEAQIAHFRFGTHVVAEEIETRIRLSGTQEVLAVAELADGTLWTAAAEVIVSVSACIDGLL